MEDTDGGWAWAVLGGSMLGLFVSGLQRYFVGVMHAELLQEYQASNTATAWVGAVYMALMDLGGPIASAVIGRYGCRVCSIAGSLLCFFGFGASAFTTSISQLFLTYGLIAGMGLALSYSPSVLSVGYYFHRLLPLASGLASGAAAIGMLSGPLLIQTLARRYGVSGGFLLLGAISLHHCVSGMFFRPRALERCHHPQTSAEVPEPSPDREEEKEEEEEEEEDEEEEEEEAEKKQLDGVSSFPMLGTTSVESVNERDGSSGFQWGTPIESVEKQDGLGSFPLPGLPVESMDEHDGVRSFRMLATPTKSVENHDGVSHFSMSGASSEEGDQTARGTVNVVDDHTKESLKEDSDQTERTEDPNRTVSDQSTKDNDVEERCILHPHEDKGLDKSTETRKHKTCVLHQRENSDDADDIKAEHQGTENSCPLQSTSCKKSADNVPTAEEEEKEETDTNGQNQQTSRSNQDSAIPTTTPNPELDIQDIVIDMNTPSPEPNNEEEVVIPLLNHELVNMPGNQGPGMTRCRLKEKLPTDSWHRTQPEVSSACAHARKEGFSKEDGRSMSIICRVRRVTENYRVVLSNRAFLLHCLSLLLSHIHQSGVFLHLPKYVQTLGTSPAMAAQLFVFAGCGSLISRVGAGMLTTDPDIDPLVVSIGMTGLASLATLLLPFYSGGYAGQTVFCLLTGLYTGGLAALLNVLTSRLVGLTHLHTGFGFSVFCTGVGGVLGPLVAALVVDHGGQYEHSYVILGSVMLAASFLDLMAGVTYLRQKGPADVNNVATT